MNSWNFIGRVGHDGEFRVTTSGKSVLSFSVAVDSGFGQQKKTTWARVTVWGNRAESLAQYVLKGNQIGVTGDVSLNEFTTKEGVKQYNLDVNASDVTLIKSANSADKAQPTPMPYEDDDIPFN